jgi:hypothetical protein
VADVGEPEIVTVATLVLLEDAVKVTVLSGSVTMALILPVGARNV